MGSYFKWEIWLCGFVIALTACAVVPPAVAGAAPVNDDFGSATKLFGTDLTKSGSTVGAGVQAGEPNHAGNSGGHSVWFRWMPPHDGTYRIDTCDSGFDTLLSVYTGASLDSLSTVGESDDAPGCQPRSGVTFSADSHTVYRIAVDGKNGAVGSLGLTLQGTPENDDLANAQPLFGTEDTGTANNTLAGKQAGEPNHAGNSGGHSVWFRWAPSVAGDASVNTCGSEVDTVLAVYTETQVGSLTQIAANDDGALCGPQSEVSFPATTGTRYLIAVDGKDGATGGVSVTVEGRPENDDFAGAAELVGARLPGRPYDQRHQGGR